MKKILIIMMIAILPVSGIAAQSSPDDPAVIKAKKETAAVFDLGRMFGYLNTMEKKEKKLSLNKEQMEELYRIMNRIRQADRMEPEAAEEMLTTIEDDILTPDQLMYTDQLAIERMNTRTPKTGSGGGQITSYIAGGPFNPMKDPSKTIGKDFDAFYKYLSKKLGK